MGFERSYSENFDEFEHGNREFSCLFSCMIWLCYISFALGRKFNYELYINWITTSISGLQGHCGS
jgi:hypothetical protein